MQAETFVPFVFFGFLAAVILGPILIKERTKRSAHKLVGEALARGQTLDPALIEQLTRNMLEEGNRARKSLGRGVILLALAAGLVGAGFMISRIEADADAVYAMGIPAIVCASVGAAFLLLATIDFAMRKREA